MGFPKCPSCGEIITQDDCGGSTDADGFTDCCGISIYSGETREEEDGDTIKQDI